MPNRLLLNCFNPICKHYSDRGIFCPCDTHVLRDRHMHGGSRVQGGQEEGREDEFCSSSQGHKWGGGTPELSLTPHLHQLRGTREQAEVGRAVEIPWQRGHHDMHLKWGGGNT